MDDDDIDHVVVVKGIAFSLSRTPDHERNNGKWWVCLSSPSYSERGLDARDEEALIQNGLPPTPAQRDKLIAAVVRFAKNEFTKDKSVKFQSRDPSWPELEVADGGNPGVLYIQNDAPSDLIRRMEKFIKKLPGNLAFREAIKLSDELDAEDAGEDTPPKVVNPHNPTGVEPSVDTNPPPRSMIANRRAAEHMGAMRSALQQYIADKLGVDSPNGMKIQEILADENWNTLKKPLFDVLCTTAITPENIALLNAKFFRNEISNTANTRIQWDIQELFARPFIDAFRRCISEESNAIKFADDKQRDVVLTEMSGVLFRYAMTLLPFYAGVKPPDERHRGR